MNKHQVVWLIIRLAGVYCAFLAVMTFFSLVGSVPPLFTLPKIDVPNKNANVPGMTPTMPTPRPMPPGFGPNGMDPQTSETPKTDKNEESITDKFKSENFKNFIYYLFLTLIYAAATWYLLRDGRILYSVLSHEEPLGLKAAKEPEVTTLNLGQEPEKPVAEPTETVPQD